MRYPAEIVLSESVLLLCCAAALIQAHTSCFVCAKYKPVPVIAVGGATRDGETQCVYSVACFIYYSLSNCKNAKPPV